MKTKCIKSNSRKAISRVSAGAASRFSPLASLGINGDNETTLTLKQALRKWQLILVPREEWLFLLPCPGRLLQPPPAASADCHRGSSAESAGVAALHLIYVAAGPAAEVALSGSDGHRPSRLSVRGQPTVQRRTNDSPLKRRFCRPADLVQSAGDILMAVQQNPVWPPALVSSVGGEIGANTTIKHCTIK